LGITSGVPPNGAKKWPKHAVFSTPHRFRPFAKQHTQIGVPVHRSVKISIFLFGSFCRPPKCQKYGVISRRCMLSASNSSGTISSDGNHVRTSVVCLSVCMLATNVNPAKTAEPIKMRFGLWTRVVHQIEPEFPWGRGIFRGSDAASC